MNSRWYIGALIIIFSVLGGIANRQQDNLPNQEVILQFVNKDLTSDAAQYTISAVKQQLQDIGVNNITIVEQDHGELKISYYSDTDAAIIKNILELDKTSSDEKQSPSQFPTQNTSLAYNFDVYDLHKDYDVSSNLGGKLALELKANTDRFSNPNEYIPVKGIIIKGEEAHVKVAYKFYKTIAVAIDNNSQKIPEVRAGPHC